jgi:hypothetical protein
LTQLREHHSFLRLPDNLTEEQKQKAMAARKVTLRAPSPEEKARPLSPFRVRTQPEGHLVHFGEQDFALVSIPMCVGKHSKWTDNFVDFREYATKLHAVAAGLEFAHPSGWIIDLRGNGGGNMWPMLAGIGFVLGEGNLGYFVDGKSIEVAWRYQDGALYAQNTNQNEFSLDPPLKLPQLLECPIFCAVG